MSKQQRQDFSCKKYQKNNLNSNRKTQKRKPIANSVMEPLNQSQAGGQCNYAIQESQGYKHDLPVGCGIEINSVRSQSSDSPDSQTLGSHAEREIVSAKNKGKQYQKQQAQVSDVDSGQSQLLDTNGEKEQPECTSASANSAPDFVEDQVSGTHIEHTGQSDYNCMQKQLAASSSVPDELEMNYIYTCIECKHFNWYLKEIIDTHPKREFYIEKLKELHSAREMKCDQSEPQTSEVLSADPVEFPSQKYSDHDMSSAESQPDSHLPSVQLSCHNTATNNPSCDRDDDKKDICGSVERGREYVEDWFEAPGIDDGQQMGKIDERERSGDRQKMNRRGKDSHSRERRSDNNRRTQGNDNYNWRSQDKKRQHNTDSRWSADDQGGRGSSKRYDHIKYKIVKEVTGDLFEAPKEFSLAHCVASDMRMGSGIAVNFRDTFKSVGELLDQNARVGHIAVLEREGRFIYYLVTKQFSYEKPCLADLVSSLKKMRDHCVEHDVKCLAMPRIGCGLDRLDWKDVKPKIEEVFSGLDINIAIYNYNQPESDKDSYSSRSKRSLPVKHERYCLVDIEAQTALIFFGSEDGGVDECGKLLDHKFRFLHEYRTQQKTVGQVIRLLRNNEVMYGLIVRKRENDAFSYVTFEKCLYELRKIIRKDKFIYVGIEAFLIGDDNATVEKVISVVKNVLLNPELQLYVCWPEKLQAYHNWTGEIMS